MADDRKKITSEQLLILIEELEKDPTLGYGKVGGVEAREQYNEKWEELTERLNSVEKGALKNTAKWQQAWRDWKSNTKKKAAKFAIEKEQDNNQSLTPLEQRVLEMSEADPSDNGIDISTIAELDQSLSSDWETEDSNEQYDYGGSNSNLTASDMISMSSEKETCVSLSKRAHSSDRNKVFIKKKRRQNDSLELISRQNESILSRLAHMEQVQSDQHQYIRDILSKMSLAMEMVVAMGERLLVPLNTLVQILGPGDGVEPPGG